MAKTIKDARLAKGLKQQDIAELLGVTQVFVSNIENGKESPSESMRKIIYSVLGNVAFPRDSFTGNEPKRIVTKGNAIVPFYRTMISAGVKGPTLEDDVDEFDVGEHYQNTCVYEVSGDSMIKAGIEAGDRVVVKLGHRFANRDIILCRYNGS